MKIDVVTFDSKKAGSMELSGKVFGVDARSDILHMIVRWQLAKRRQGTHSVLTRSEVSYSTKKIVRQKGSGSGRHGSRRAPIFRKGGVYKGPKPRSHSFKLNKKFKALGIRHALSSKLANGQLVILDKAELKEGRTKEFSSKLSKLGWGRTLVVGGENKPECDNFNQAAKNIPNFTVLPIEGLNVYDILQKDTLVLTRGAVEVIEARFK